MLVRFWLVDAICHFVRDVFCRFASLTRRTGHPRPALAPASKYIFAEVSVAKESVKDTTSALPIWRLGRGHCPSTPQSPMPRSHRVGTIPLAVSGGVSLAITPYRGVVLVPPHGTE